MNELLQEIQDLKSLILKPKLKVYSLTSASKEFGVSRGTLEKGRDAGILKYLKNGSKTYVTEDAIKEFLESNKELV